MSYTILVIDDNPDLLNNTSEILELAGYQTLKAEHGKAGLEIAKQQKPDLILCDIMMPQLDGYGVLRAIGNFPAYAQIPFIFMSAKTDRVEVRQGMDLGADDYITKPFTGDELIRIVNVRLKKYENLKKSLTCTLEGIDDFISQTLSISDLTKSRGQQSIKKLRKNDVLFLEGDSSSYLYYVVSGKIKTFKSNKHGKDYITSIYKAQDFLGYPALFDNKKLAESAIAIEDSEVIRISHQDFLVLLYSNNETALKFIKLLSNNLSDLSERLLKMAYDSARKRVAEALIYIAQKESTTDATRSSFPLHRENIAAIAGVAPESVSRNLTDLRSEKLIEIGNGTLTILDMKKLENIKG